MGNKLYFHALEDTWRAVKPFAVSLIFGGVLLYFVLQALYRVYLHPLRKIPGPKLAAASYLYEFYWDVYKGGLFLFQIQKMHERYGPIVRINPREVHIKDPHFYDEIYASGVRKRDKDAQFLKAYSVPGSMVATVDHDHHRYRRNILNAYFSKKSVNELSPVIEGKVQKLMQRFAWANQDGSIMRLDDAFSALASDVITQYSFGESWNFLDDKDFRRDIRHAITETSNMIHINRFFPFVGKTMRMIPPWLIVKLQPAKASLLNFMKSIFDMAARGIAAETNTTGKRVKRETIFKSLTDPVLPPEERTFMRVAHETGVILQAGTESISRSLTIAAFYLADQPILRDKLREELRTILSMPTNTASWAQLEQMPYLTGVVYECLRLSYGLIIRLPRCAPTEVLQYEEYTIPKGTPMSMSTYFVHHDESIFPDSYSFKPERWVEKGGNSDRLTKYMVSFTRGSRACLGMNLSYLVLYTTIASFVRQFDMELYKTTVEDLEVVRDFGLGLTKKGEVEVSARISNVLKE